MHKFFKAGWMHELKDKKKLYLTTGFIEISFIFIIKKTKMFFT